MVVADEQNGGVAILAAQVRRDRPPYFIARCCKVEQVDRMIGTEAEVFQPKRVLDS